ncbi:MAG: hypothetical protein ACLQME_16225 [Alphaproteobacteria bacterium]
MSNNVNNPPALVPQETAAWCFAAAELMARNFYNLATPTQYAIARASVMLLVEAQAPPTYAQWSQATEDDLVNNQDENGGANRQSQRVQLVRNAYGAIIPAAIHGQMTNDYTELQFKADIDDSDIVIIGNAIHYYVVYGYDDTDPKNFTLRVRDPWPRNVGGQRQTIPHSELATWNNRVVIHF